jgi:Ras-related protein Rab-32
MYYREALGGIFVFDVTRQSTLKNIKKWKEDLDAKVRLEDANKSTLPVILLANKVQLFLFYKELLSILSVI